MWGEEPRVSLLERFNPTRVSTRETTVSVCVEVCVRGRKKEGGGLLCFPSVLRRLGCWRVDPVLTRLLDLKFSLAGSGPLSCLRRDWPHPCRGHDADMPGGPLCPRTAHPGVGQRSSQLHWWPGPPRPCLAEWEPEPGPAELCLRTAGGWSKPGCTGEGTAFL